MAVRLEKELTEAVHQKLKAEGGKQDALDQVNKYTPNLSDTGLSNNFGRLSEMARGTMQVRCLLRGKLIDSRLYMQFLWVHYLNNVII